MDNLLHRHQAWLSALALIFGFAIAAAPVFAPPRSGLFTASRPIRSESQQDRDLEAAFGANYVDENISLRELHIADFRQRSHAEEDSAARREARDRLPALERELGELRCLRQ